MQQNDPYQSPVIEPTSESIAAAKADSTVKLWLPQATMMAEQGKSETSIRLFFKGKEVSEHLLAPAVQLATECGLKGKRKTALPYQIAAWILIGIAGTWLAYILIVHHSFSFFPLLPIAVGYGLLNGSYLRDKK